MGIYVDEIMGIYVDDVIGRCEDDVTDLNKDDVIGTTEDDIIGKSDDDNTVIVGLYTEVVESTVSKTDEDGITDAVGLK